MQSADQADVIAFLSEPRSYGGDIAAVERRETHGAIVFLAGERAYKLKRAVRYPYMDFSTLALRDAMCHRELEVNRRTAPALYLEVLPIVRDRRRRIRFGRPHGKRGVLDWVVVMRRFPQDALFEQLRRNGKLDLGLMRTLAEAIASFHRSAEVTPTFGGSAGIGAVIDENAEALGSMRDIFPAADVERLIGRQRERLQSLSPLLESRRQSGFVRHCHGDLHLNNIYLDAGAPVLFDAIEFEDAFSCIDVLYDLSLLLTDILRHGLRAHANALLNRYLEKTFDHDGLPALPLFLSCRAAMRAHVLAAAGKLARDAARAVDLRNDAVDLFRSALSHLEPTPPRLIALGGASGTGKTTLAYGLAPDFAPEPGAIVARSDIVRKHLAAVAETAHLNDEAYAQETNAGVYRKLRQMACDIAAAGYTAIVDAVHGNVEDRASLEATAKSASVPFVGLWLRAPPPALESRIEDRRGDASDATVAVLHRQLQTVSTPRDWHVLDAAQSASGTLAAAREVLFPIREPARPPR